MEQHLSCLMRSFEDGSIDPEWNFHLTSRGIGRRSIEQAAASLVETVAPGMRDTQLLVRLTPPAASACDGSAGLSSRAGEPALVAPAADWRIRFEGHRDVILDFAGQPPCRAVDDVLPVECPGAGPDIYETVLLAFVMPFVGSTVTWLDNDWADVMSIVGSGSRGRLVVTSLALQATTEELAAAHRRDLRAVDVGLAAAAYSVFVAPRRPPREQALAKRVICEEGHEKAHVMTPYVPVLRSDQVRMATLCVY